MWVISFVVNYMVLYSHLLVFDSFFSVIFACPIILIVSDKKIFF